MRYKLLVAMVFILAISGCSKSPEKLLVGRWMEVDDPKSNLMEFFPDGTFVIQPPEERPGLLGPSQVTGSWLILDENRLKMTIPVAFGEPQVRIANMKFEGDQLSLVGDVGKASILKRYKPK